MNTFDVGRKQLTDKPIIPVVDTRYLNLNLVFILVLVHLLIIVLVRYFYMSRFETFLGAHEPVPRAHKYLAKTVHLSMYACLALLPLTGLAIAGLFTRGVEDGFLMEMALGLHGFAADLSYALIAIHIAAAIYSRLKGEGVWTSMVPLWKERGTEQNALATTLTSLENKAVQMVKDLIPTKKD